MNKKIILIGGYRKAVSLTASLIKKGYKITVINNDMEKCRQMAKNADVNVIFGDGTKPFVLEEAGADTAAVSIALTSDDATNLIVSELCKKKYFVRKTVALVNDPSKTEFFHKMGVDSVVCAINAITSIIEQNATVEQIANSIPLGDGRVSIAEVGVDGNSPALDKKLWEINLPKEVIIGCILRGDQTIIPRGDTRVLGGDTLVVISSTKEEQEAVIALTGK